jgi:hypothetical protein
MLPNPDVMNYPAVEPQGVSEAGMPEKRIGSGIAKQTFYTECI